MQGKSEDPLQEAVGESRRIQNIENGVAGANSFGVDL